MAVIEKVLAHFPAVRSTGSGKYLAPCPGHDDRHPSLSIAEGERGVLLKCWAGCRLEEITGAMGIDVADLFYDAGRAQRSRRRPRPTQPRWNIAREWQRVSLAFLSHAQGLWIDAQRVIDAARGLDISRWNDDDLDIAIGLIADAHEKVARADLLEDVAVDLRIRHLEARHAS